MKNIFVIVCAMLLQMTMTVTAQTSSPSESATDSLLINSLKRALDEKKYALIPSAEFEERLDTKMQQSVTSNVDQKFNNLRNIVLLVLALIGGGIVFGLKSLIGNSVKDQMDKEMKEMQTRLDDDIEMRVENYFLKNYQAIIDKQLKANKESIDLELKKVNDTQNDINAQMKDIKKYLASARLQQITAEITDKKVTNETFNALLDLLKEAEAQNDIVLLGNVINELSFASYYLRKDTEMENILRRFMDQRDINIKETVFMNMASGFFYNYSATYDSTDRQKCLLFLNEALKRANGYGEALGLKLELFMIDYEKSQRKEEKDMMLSEAKSTIEQIKKMDLSAHETLKRFDRVRTNETERSCINLLHELFPDDMAAIKRQADNYRLKNEKQSMN